MPGTTGDPAGGSRPPNPTQAGPADGDALYRALFEVAAVGVAHLSSASGRFLRVNQKYCDLVGYTREEMEGTDFQSITHPDDVRRDVANMELLKAGAIREFTMEKRYVRKDGSVVWVVLSVSPLWRPGEPVSTHVAVVVDVTERKRAEEALEQQRDRLEQQAAVRAAELHRVHEKLELAQRAAGAGMWDWEFSTGALSWSPELFALFGLDPAAGPSFDAWRAALHPDDRQAAEDRIGDAIRDRVRLESDYRVVWPSGDVRWIHALGDTIENDRGEQIRMMGICLDVTRLRQSEERLRSVFDAMSEGFSVQEVICDAAGRPADLRFIDANKAFEQQTGLKNAETLGHTLRELFPQSEQYWIDRYGHVGLSGEPTSFEAMFGPLNRHYRVNAFQVAPGRFGTMFTDISEQKRAEEIKIRLEAELQQAQKMESVGRLAGGVAHDFNNMLGVIIGHTELAMASVYPGHPLFADLTEIRGAARRSADLTRQLLAFARRQDVVTQVLDFNAAVEGMLNMLRRLIGEDIDLQWRPGADLWAVRLDPNQVDQILANLCVNARDAIKGIGRITITTDNCTVGEAAFEANRGVLPGDYVRISVSDDGCGMDSDTLSQIFEPFFTTKDVGHGTGLGLASVYGAVKQNGGFIDVQSQKGAGATFTIYLPRCVDLAEPEATASPAATPPVPGHETILLVEDEPAILSLTAKVLQRHGYRVLGAPTPGDALRLAREYAGEIHLLMTDVVMPEMNGRALAAQLLERRPNLKCLFMSGYTADVIARQGIVGEGVHFLQKPFSIDVVTAKVRETLEAG